MDEANESAARSRVFVARGGRGADADAGRWVHLRTQEGLVGCVAQSVWEMARYVIEHWSYGVMVSTLDFESSDPGSNPGMTSFWRRWCSGKDVWQRAGLRVGFGRMV